MLADCQSQGKTVCYLHYSCKWPSVCSNWTIVFDQREMYGSWKAYHNRSQKKILPLEFYKLLKKQTYMSSGSATSLYLIFISRGKSISSFTSQSLLTSTEESRGFSWASKCMCTEEEETRGGEGGVWEEQMLTPMLTKPYTEGSIGVASSKCIKEIK